MLSIEYSNTEIQQIVFSNVMLMLSRRKLVENDISKIKKIDNNIYTINLDNNIKYDLFFLPNKLQNISQNTAQYDYLTKNNDLHIIVIGKEVSKKVVNQILYVFNNNEFFFEHELMEDLISKIFIPKHILLSKEETKELLDKFTRKELPKMLVTDIMSRYYNAKQYDIFKIMRPSITSGYSLIYREVINSSVNNMFKL